jgi:tetratricopeptide (TPR) repeat protein
VPVPHKATPEPRPRRATFRIARGGFAVALLVAGLALAVRAPAQTAAQDAGSFEQSKQYAACMVLARDRPQEAYDSAGAWLAENGGAPARHCRAAALIGLNRFAEAADLLIQIANEMATTDARRPLLADLYGQAAQAWLMAGDSEQALVADNAALALQPDDVELRIDRAVVNVSVGSYWEAIDDLNRANELAPERADILVLRASAYRYVESPELAREDIDRALALDAANAEAYLERGILEGEAGDIAAARADFLKAVELAPDSPTAEAAQARLQQLELPAP